MVTGWISIARDLRAMGHSYTYGFVTVAYVTGRFWIVGLSHISTVRFYRPVSFPLRRLGYSQYEVVCRLAPTKTQKIKIY
jgi:hypothetical protein